jgi:hypothetical protein
VTTSGGNRSGGGRQPHLGVDGCREVATLSHDGETFFFRLGDAPVVLRPRRGVGQLQQLSAVLVQAVGAREVTEVSQRRQRLCEENSGRFGARGGGGRGVTREFM